MRGTTICLSTLLVVFVTTPAWACGPGNSLGVARGGSKNGFVPGLAAVPGGGFFPGVQAAGLNKQFAAGRQAFAKQAAAHRAKTRGLRVARFTKQRQEMLAKRAERREIMIAQRQQRERQRAVADTMLVEQRTWSDNSGEYRMAGRFAGINNRHVQIRTDDGRLINVPLTRLSMSDRQWVAGHRTDPQPAVHGNPVLIAAR